MASYKLTDDEVTDFAMAANNYVKLETSYTDLLPIKKIDDCYKHTWYVSTEFDGPQSSKDGREGYDVRTARTENSANVASLVYTFEIPRVEATMAQNAGVPLWSENVGNGLRKMNANICNWITTGTNAWDKVAITGMYTGGTVCATALDAIYWSTATSAFQHANAAFGQLNGYGFKGPFHWVLSSSLRSGLNIKYGAGDPSQIEMLDPFEVPKENLIFLEGSGISTTATTRMNLYPMGSPAGDDGTWLFYKKDPNYAYVAEVMPITTTISPELDVRRQCYHGRIEWRGTVAIVQAHSICYEEQVDLVV